MSFTSSKPSCSQSSEIGFIPVLPTYTPLLPLNFASAKFYSLLLSAIYLVSHLSTNNYLLTFILNISLTKIKNRISSLCLPRCAIHIIIVLFAKLSLTFYLSIYLSLTYMSPIYPTSLINCAIICEVIYNKI